MELIFNNQLSILIDILPFYLTPKQCIKYYSSNNFLYKIYLKNNKFKNNYFMPKTNKELYTGVNEWCKNKEEAIIKYGHISYWNTININNMVNLFAGQHNFNDDINDWNTSNVINMGCIFSYCYNFNQSLNNWNVSNVINMEYMFYNTKEFNQNLNKWNIKNVKFINHIFYGSTYFDKLNCKDWDLSNIVNKIYMFGYKN